VNAIDITNFSKKFGQTNVISDLSFALAEGQILTFLGANGSGKTTTIRALLNIYPADKGELLVFGQQQKPQLEQHSIARPKLLNLDEPTKGLDPVNRQLFLDIFNDLNEQKGTSILFSTDMMKAAEKITDKVVMIHQGKRALYGSATEVRQSFGNRFVTLKYQGQLPKEFKR